MWILVKANPTTEQETTAVESNWCRCVENRYIRCSKCGTSVVCLWYVCGMLLVRLSSVCGMLVVCLWCACGSFVLGLWAGCGRICGAYLWSAGLIVVLRALFVVLRALFDHNGNRDGPQREPQLVQNGPQRESRRTTTGTTTDSEWTTT